MLARLPRVARHHVDPDRRLPRRRAQPGRRVPRPAAGCGAGSPRDSSSLTALLVLTAIGFLVIPPLIRQVTDFVDAVPGPRRGHDRGTRPARLPRARLRPRRADPRGDRGARAPAASSASPSRPSRSRGASSPPIVGIVTIAFLTLFMLLEGPRTIERFLGSLPRDMAVRWRRVGVEIYRTIGGYVTGNLVISLIAGVATTIVLARRRERLRGRARRSSSRSSTSSRWPARRSPRSS